MLKRGFIPAICSGAIEMRVLKLGAAGSIGSNLFIRLLERGYMVVGIDNHNADYDPSLKEARSARLANHPNYTHL